MSIYDISFFDKNKISSIIISRGNKMLAQIIMTSSSDGLSKTLWINFKNWVTIFLKIPIHNMGGDKNEKET
jgi:hypothetical protein